MAIPLGAFLKDPRLAGHTKGDDADAISRRLPVPSELRTDLSRNRNGLTRSSLVQDMVCCPVTASMQPCNVDYFGFPCEISGSSFDLFVCPCSETSRVN